IHEATQVRAGRGEVPDPIRVVAAHHDAELALGGDLEGEGAVQVHSPGQGRVLADLATSGVVTLEVQFGLPGAGVYVLPDHDRVAGRVGTDGGSGLVALNPIVDAELVADWLAFCVEPSAVNAHARAVEAVVRPDHRRLIPGSHGRARGELAAFSDLVHLHGRSGLDVAQELASLQSFESGPVSATRGGASAG